MAGIHLPRMLHKEAGEEMKEYITSKQKDEEIARLERENKWLKHDLEAAEMKAKAYVQIDEANRALLTAVLKAVGADYMNPVEIDMDIVKTAGKAMEVSGIIDMNSRKQKIYYIER